MKKMTILIIATTIAMTFSNLAFGNEKTTINVRVTKISDKPEWINLTFQTDPRPDISGLDCKSTYWIRVDKRHPNFPTTLQMLMNAKSNGQPVSVTVKDGTGEFCSLERLTLN